MPRRDWSLDYVCGHDGCRETVTYRYQTKRDRTDSFEVRNFSNGRWRCIRHANPSEILSSMNCETRHELVVNELPYGKFFGNAGFISGPGFKAFAKDFPVGSKVVVTAQLILPDEEEPRP